MCFKAISERLAKLKLKVAGGSICLVSCYAPHSSHTFEARSAFFDSFGQCLQAPTTHSAMIALGDFNARLRCTLPGEEAIVGPHVFKSAVADANAETSNRELLIERCVAARLFVANTFFELPDTKKVTYRGLSTRPMEEISDKKFGQIDHILCHRDSMALVDSCASSRMPTLASHHFITICDLTMSFEKHFDTGSRPQPVLSSLQCTRLRDDFSASFHETMVATDVTTGTLSDHADAVAQAFSVASAIIPQSKFVKQKPWIST